MGALPFLFLGRFRWDRARGPLGRDDRSGHYPYRGMATGRRGGHCGIGRNRFSCRGHLWDLKALATLFAFGLSTGQGSINSIPRLAGGTGNNHRHGEHLLSAEIDGE